MKKKNLIMINNKKSWQGNPLHKGVENACSSQSSNQIPILIWEKHKLTKSVLKEIKIEILQQPLMKNK